MWGDSGGGAAKLGLHIRNVAALDNGVPVRIELDQRGAVIGRSPTVDWSLPDPRSYISSRHAEIDYAGGQYRLVDVSTNGTFLNGATERAHAPHILRDGDVIAIGHYEIVVTLSGGPAPAPPPAAAPPAASGWGGWDVPATTPPAGGGWGVAPVPPANLGGGATSAAWSPPAVARPDAGGWGTPSAAPGWGDATPAPPAADGWAANPPAPPAGDGWGAAAAPAGDGWGAPPAPSAPPAAGWATPASSFAAPGGAFVPPARAEAVAPNPSAWDRPAEAAPPASDWSSPAAERPSAPSADDVWGKIADGNVVDWARGGFGQSLIVPPPAAAPLGLAASPAAALPPAPPPAPTAFTPPAPVAADGGAAMERFLAEAGLKRSELKAADGDVLAAAGGLVRRLVAGLVVMLEARARAKGQMGAQSTALEFDGNNPIKFARTPEGALAQLLNPTERGFMASDRAVEDAYHDLQSHQIATLKAMQGALKATLDRFSPTAIRKRAESKGMLARILPGARDAALWQAYEREFGGVAHGSDEAFMDVFAREFKRAYEEQAARRPKR